MIDKFPEEILKAIIGRRLVPFIGAGFSWFFNFPSWGELLNGIASELKLNIDPGDLSGKDPLQVAESFFCHYKDLYYEKVKEESLERWPQIEKIEGGEKIFESMVEKQLELNFSRLVLENLSLHKEFNDIFGARDDEDIIKLSKINEIPFRNIVTTNYDKILDELFTDFAVLSPGRADEFGWDEAGNTIFKIHGDVDIPEGIIFTHSQYYRFMNELGFYRSRLYTIFSSNVVLMMGYGFGDINVHNIYFQFRRDYKDHLANSSRRAYIALGDYDKEKLGTYYQSYVGFLKSHGIEVLDNFGTLPNFVEGLALAVQQFRERAELQTLFEGNIQQWDSTQSIIIDLIKNNLVPNINVFNDASVKNVLIALDKIVSYPEVLTQKPFQMEIHSGILSQDDGLRILKFVNEVIEAREEVAEWNEYTRFVLASLKFVNQTRDFDWHPPRVNIFLKLASKMNDIIGVKQLEDEFGQQMKDLFYFSNRIFGSCWKSGDLLSSQLIDVPSCLIESYLKYRIGTVAKGQWYLPTEEKTWKNKIKDTFSEEDFPTISGLIEQLEEVLEKAKEEFFSDEDDD